MPAKKKVVKDLSFEQSFDELEAILASVDAEKIPLQDIVERFDRGTQLLNHCRNLLGDAQKKIEIIKLAPTKSKNELAQKPRLSDDSAAIADSPDDDIQLF